MNPATRRAAVLAACLLVHAASPPPAPGQGLVPPTAVDGTAATGVILPPAAAPACRDADATPVGGRGGRAGPREQPRNPIGALRAADPGHGPGRRPLRLAPQPVVRHGCGTTPTTPSATFLDGGRHAGRQQALQQRLHRQPADAVGGRLVHGRAGTETRRTTTSFFSSFNPALSSNLRLSYTQPLLQELRHRRRAAAGDDGHHEPGRLPTSGCARTDCRDRAQRTGTRTGIWSSPSPSSTCSVSRSSSPRSRCATTGRGVEVGTMAPIDIVEAEAEVARNEEAVIPRRGADRPRRGPPAHARPRSGGPRTSGPYASSRPTRRCSRPRRDRRRRGGPHRHRRGAPTSTSSAKQIDNTDTNARFFANQRLPDVNLHVDYSVAGLGGGAGSCAAPGFPGRSSGSRTVRVRRRPRRSARATIFPSWQVGLTVGYPLGRSTADANLARDPAGAVAGRGAIAGDRDPHRQRGAGRSPAA